MFYILIYLSFLTKVNRVIAFKQKELLKPWIDFNTEKRKQATSDFEKDNCKFNEQRSIWKNDGECQGTYKL